MRKTTTSAGVDLLRKVEQDLQHMPRHQWDGYLWDFCREFVRLGSSCSGTVRKPTAAPSRDAD